MKNTKDLTVEPQILKLTLCYKILTNFIHKCKTQQ